MTHQGDGREWARRGKGVPGGDHPGQHWGQHRSGWAGSDWGGGDWQRGWTGGGGGWGGRGAPPPWLAGLFGLAHSQPPRGPKVRKGDVRAAILDVLATEPMNGYQVIQQIGERTAGSWRPSPGSVYPTIQQLEDEGLITGDEPSGRRTLRLTPEGEAYVAEHPEELAAVWEPFGQPGGEEPIDFAAVKPELGQLMSAVWQIITSGTDRQRREAIVLLSETRRKLYGLLADEDRA